jgi:GDP-L-fucose synthase
MNEGDRIYVAGHGGLVGSAVVRELERLGHRNVLMRSREDLDLRDQAAVRGFFEAARPEYVVLAAAKVGGIRANGEFPADFIRDNLQIQTNVIDSAWRAGVRKLCFLGSSCVYPRLAPQPIPEQALLSGPLEPTNEPYAVAKIAGIKMCQAYRRQYGFSAISLMPTNLYGPHDDFDPETGHVIAALMRRCHEAKLRGDQSLPVWGTGTPRREFLHVDDLATAIVHLMQVYDDAEPLNVGMGADVTIREVAEMIREVVGFAGQLEFDPTRPDGTPRKLLDVSRVTALGWTPKIGLRQGLCSTYAWFLAAPEPAVAHRIGAGGGH